jgi:4-amino-4-deoxy-L-arabinose transferase-like glycosyltransferase
VSATLIPPRTAPPRTYVPPESATAAPAPGRGGPRDRTVIAALALCFAVLTALTWRKWGVPEIDAGAELTTADLIKHGAVAYRDVRYYYGPLGLYSLALSFKVFGTSFTTAFAFGLVQTAAILAAFYALARHWLVPLTAGLASAVLLAIGFSGTAFNFVLPHTNSATFGLLFLLLTLLALTRERPLAAGIGVGLVALTRPEFLAVAVGAAAAYAIATWRVSGRAPAWRAAWRMALPALAIPAVVYAWFAEQAGFSRLFTENLWPVKFLHAGVNTEQNWMPLSPGSILGLAARAAIYIGLLAALVASVNGWRSRQLAAARAGEHGSGAVGNGSVAPVPGNGSTISTSGNGSTAPADARGGAWRALWPLAAAALAIVLLDGLLRASGVLVGQRAAIELEMRHLVLGMSWLPALGIAVAVLAAVRLVRGQSSPLGRSWPADLALTVAALGLGLRAYNAFTTEGSYAPYFAAPLVLLLGILHERVAMRWPQARVASLGALGLVAAGLAAYALGGLYVHENTTVHTPRGSFVTSAAAAGALQAAVRQIDAQSTPSQPILAAPTDGGLYFMAARRPALYELTLLPGLLASPAEERAAVARMRREHVAVAAIGARDLSIWGTPTFGVNYDPLLGAYLRGAAVARTTVGTLADPVGGTNPSRGFTIVRLR